MAFVAPGVTPQNSDFKAASWEVNTVTTPHTYSAKSLVGPNGGVITLVTGSYDVYVRIHDNPEVPVVKSGSLRVV
jgi:hypothetical protein